MNGTSPSSRPAERRARSSNERPLATKLRAALAAERPSPSPALELRGRVPAAVLVPLYVHDATLHVVLTLRSATVRSHAGQICFPGGRRDPGDHSLLDTALREAREEIGLHPATVELLGTLPPALTMVTDYAVHPFVGLIAAGPEFTAAASEVDAVLELPLAALARSYAERILTREGYTFVTRCFDLDGHLVWGATARILADLLKRLEQAPGHAARLAS